MVGVYAKKTHFHRSPHFHRPCSLGPYRRASDVWMLHFQLKGILAQLQGSLGLHGGGWRIVPGCFCGAGVTSLGEIVTSGHMRRPGTHSIPSCEQECACACVHAFMFGSPVNSSHGC